MQKQKVKKIKLIFEGHEEIYQIGGTYEDGDVEEGLKYEDELKAIEVLE
jgi:hypothetical protein